MPGLFGSDVPPGTAGFGSTPGQRSVGNTRYDIVDPAEGASFSKIFEQLQQQMGSLQQLRQQVPQYQDLLSQGANSPLMQQAIQAAMGGLRPGQDRARQAMMDQFRSAGALGSTAMGQAGAELEQGFGTQENSMIGQLLQSMLPQMTQGLGNQFNQQMQATMAPVSMLEQLLGLSRPQIVTGQEGGAGGAGGGGGASFAQMDNPLAFRAPQSGGTPGMRISGGYPQPMGGAPSMWQDPNMGGMGGGGVTGGDPGGWFANFPGGYDPFAGGDLGGGFDYSGGFAGVGGDLAGLGEDVGYEQEFEF